MTGGVPEKDYTDSVKIHAGARTVITEDISKFYSSVGIDVVRGIDGRSEMNLPSNNPGV